MLKVSRSKKNSIHSILSFSSHNWQECSSSKGLSEKHKLLRSHLEAHRLTESLEIFESIGLSGENALIILAETQAAWGCDQ
jgi:hypothetical protein